MKLAKKDFYEKKLLTEKTEDIYCEFIIIRALLKMEREKERA